MKRTNTAKVLILLAAFVFVLCAPLTAFSLDERYVADRTYWNDRGEVISTVEEKNFSCMVKNVTDPENACLYFYVSYTDSNIKSADTGDVQLVFTFDYNGESYAIHVTDGGYFGTGNTDAGAFADVKSNFESAVSKDGAGFVLVGIELKDRAASSENSVKCEYFCGEKSHYIFKDLKADFTPETTADTEKTTKAQNGTTAKSSSPKDGGEADGNDGGKTTQFSVDSEKTTKFRYKGDDSENGTGDIVIHPEKEGASGKRPVSKALLAVGAAFILSGIILVVYSLTQRRKKAKSRSDNNKNNGENERTE